MHNVIRRLAAIAVAATTFAGAFQPALAQTYPDKPIKFIVPFPPGGNTDRVARLYALKLAENMGQPVIIDNRGGATGVIGLSAAVKSAPDGYTVVIGDLSTLIVNQFSNPNLPYELFKDFAPVSKLAEVSIVITARNDLPAASLAEFITLARSNPGRYSYATSGIGSIGHLSFELLRSMTGIDVRHVPYKGGGPAVTDLIGGHVDLVVDGAALPFVLDGKVKAMATTGPRLNALPKVPTVAESGVPGYNVTNWWGLYAPANTPAPVVQRLAQEVRKIAASKDVVEQLDKAGILATSSTPAELTQLMRADQETIGRVIKQAGIVFN
jgi:tripartite-type tricarboxylate transporter receptor subunit TctC